MIATTRSTASREGSWVRDMLTDLLVTRWIELDDELLLFSDMIRRHDVNPVGWGMAGDTGIVTVQVRQKVCPYVAAPYVDPRLVTKEPVTTHLSFIESRDVLLGMGPSVFALETALQIPHG